MDGSKQRARVAVIGAGLSGLACANALAAEGHTVQVFDKGRAPGGRASTRRVAIRGVEVGFDHGAQYFTARDPDTVERVARWEREGVVRRWKGRIAVLGPGGAVESYSDKDRYVGTPGMSALCKRLAAGLNVGFGVKVGQVRRVGEGLTILDADGRSLGAFDFGVVTAPPAQTQAIVSDASSSLASRAASVAMKPCWAVMVAFDRVIETPYDGAFINVGPLSWVARTSRKPGRVRSFDRWVLHASADWSTRHLERTPDLVTSQLLDAFFEATGVARVKPVWAKAHRWRYALAENPLELGCVFDGGSRIALSGDWTHANRVEGALLSGWSAAARIHEAALA